MSAKDQKDSVMFNDEQDHSQTFKNVREARIALKKAREAAQKRAKPQQS